MPANEQGGAPRVLVVDDDPDLVAICSLVLESEGYSVATALDGFEAYERVAGRKEKVDVVLLDVMMPVLDGLTVCKMVKRNPVTKDVPVIVMSASERLLQEGEASCANAVLPKPFDLDLLIDTVNQLAYVE